MFTSTHTPSHFFKGSLLDEKVTAVEGGRWSESVAAAKGTFKKMFTVRRSRDGNSSARNRREGRGGGGGGRSGGRNNQPRGGGGKERYAQQGARGGRDRRYLPGRGAQYVSNTVTPERGYGGSYGHGGMERRGNGGDSPRGHAGRGNQGGGPWSNQQGVQGQSQGQQELGGAEGNPTAIDNAAVGGDGGVGGAYPLPPSTSPISSSHQESILQDRGGQQQLEQQSWGDGTVGSNRGEEYDGRSSGAEGRLQTEGGTVSSDSSFPQGIVQQQQHQYQQQQQEFGQVPPPPAESSNSLTPEANAIYEEAGVRGMSSSGMGGGLDPKEVEAFYAAQVDYAGGARATEVDGEQGNFHGFICFCLLCFAWLVLVFFFFLLGCQDVASNYIFLVRAWRVVVGNLLIAILLRV